MSLRPLTEEDLPLVLSWRNAPEVRYNMFTRHEITEAEHRAWFAGLQQDPQSLCFIHEDDHGQADGVVNFTQYQPAHSRSFWGFYLGKSAKRGAGTALGLDALDKAFGEMGLHKLNAEAIATNEASLRFHKKMGFQQEGLFRDFFFDGQKFIDVIRMGILSVEWTAKRNEIQARSAGLLD